MRLRKIDEIKNCSSLLTTFEITLRATLSKLKDKAGSKEEMMLKMGERFLESQKILESEGSLSLKKFKVFYLNIKVWKWKRIKGKRVKKSPFGLWVTKKHMEIFCFQFFWQEIDAPKKTNGIAGAKLKIIENFHSSKLVETFKYRVLVCNRKV